MNRGRRIVHYCEIAPSAMLVVFDNDLLAAEYEGFSHNKPEEVYFARKKIN